MAWSVAHLGPAHDVVAVTYSGDVDRTQLEQASLRPSPKGRRTTRGT